MRSNIENLDWKAVGIEEYDLIRHFVELNNSFPNNTLYHHRTGGKFYSYDLIYKNFLSKNAEIVFCSKDNNTSSFRKIYFLLNNSFICIEGVYTKPTIQLKGFPKELEKDTTIKLIGQITVLHKDLVIDEEINKLILDATIEEQLIPTVGIISRDSTGFYLNDVIIDVEYPTELELHYGEGFDNFHEKLLKRLVEKNKGISLLHGLPGTGKSYYINRIIYDLQKLTKKKVILVPSNMLSYLLEPDFNTFLLDLTQDYSLDDEFVDEEPEFDVAKGMIFILEDAEPVLLKREEGANSQATSNILNLTDGLLNSIFKIQIIATYNSDDSKIDPAVKRDKRLLAKREFKALTIEDSKKLADHIGIDMNTISKEMCVSEIYALLEKDDDEVLIDEKRKTEKKSKAGLKL